jgi:AAA15 family ATPase/GTPase
MIFHSFTVSNFRSIKEPLILTMEAADWSSKNEEVDERNLIKGPDGKYLKVKALYGANAAGKSNIWKAFFALLQATRLSGFVGEIRDNNTQSFMLDAKFRDEPSTFCIRFWIKSILYSYEFHILNRNISFEKISFEEESGDEKIIFQFKDGEITEKILPNKKSDSLIEHRINQIVNPHFPGKIKALILPYISQFFGSDSKAKELFESLVFSFSLIRSQNVFIGDMDLNIAQKISEKELKENFLMHLRYADLNIVDFEYQPKILDGVEKPGFVVTKKVGEELFKNDLSNESDGTQKFFAYWYYINFRLENGGVLIVDELDVSFHPMLTSKIVELFQNPETNPKNAQLIFITHDTQFLSLKRLRPDQIAFITRNKANATEISHLIEFDGIESDMDIRDLYMKGLLDGVPVLNLFLESFKQG